MGTGAVAGPIPFGRPWSKGLETGLGRLYLPHLSQHPLEWVEELGELEGPAVLCSDMRDDPCEVCDSEMARPCAAGAFTGALGVVDAGVVVLRLPQSLQLWPLLWAPRVLPHFPQPWVCEFGAAVGLVVERTGSVA
jgi:hypothetical protein